MRASVTRSSVRVREAAHSCASVCVPLDFKATCVCLCVCVCVSVCLATHLALAVVLRSGCRDEAVILPRVDLSEFAGKIGEVLGSTS